MSNSKSNTFNDDDSKNMITSNMRKRNYQQLETPGVVPSVQDTAEENAIMEVPSSPKILAVEDPFTMGIKKHANRTGHLEIPRNQPLKNLPNNTAAVTTTATMATTLLVPPVQQTLLESTASSCCSAFQSPLLDSSLLDVPSLESTSDALSISSSSLHESKEKETLRIYVSGAFRNMDNNTENVGGIGIWVGPDHESNVSYGFNGEQSSTAADFHAILGALDIFGEHNGKLKIVSNSLYATNVITETAEVWERNALITRESVWRTINGEIVYEQPIIKKIRDHCKRRRLQYITEFECDQAKNTEIKAAKSLGIAYAKSCIPRGPIEKLSWKVGKKDGSTITTAVTVVKGMGMIPMIDDVVRVYTDGSFKRAQQDDDGEGIGGIGVWFGPDHQQNISYGFNGSQTSLAAELYAILGALDVLRNYNGKLMILTDCTVAINLITDQSSSWEHEAFLMREKEWNIINKEVAKNRDVIKTIVDRCKERPSCFTRFRYVKGHSGVEGNVGADRLAGAYTSSRIPKGPIEKLSWKVEKKATHRMSSLTMTISRPTPPSSSIVGNLAKKTTAAVAAVTSAAAKLG